jgi:hypothetical protein
MVRGDITRIGIFPCVRSIGGHPLGYCVCITEVDSVGFGASTFFGRNIAVINKDIDTVWLETTDFGGYSADSVCLADVCCDSGMSRFIVNTPIYF